MQKDKHQDNLDFVAQHYRANAFDAKDGLEKLGLPKRQWWRTRGVAAAAVGVVLMASAAIYTIVAPQPTSDSNEIKVEKTEGAPVQTVVINKITFDDADLTTVVKEIETVYGVKIENIPTEEYRLTLSYEGTADDLVETINDLLGINLKVCK